MELTEYHPDCESHEGQDGKVQDQVDVDDDGDGRHERQSRSGVNQGNTEIRQSTQ